MQPLTQNRSTVLHLAGKYGHENVFKLLVELGAYVNAEDLVRLVTVGLHTHTHTHFCADA
jgi:hypothetical protein